MAFIQCVLLVPEYKKRYIYRPKHKPSTYDHRISNARLPVRSALDKWDTGELVVRWVTTGESSLLYVFAIIFGPEMHAGLARRKQCSTIVEVTGLLFWSRTC
jgi:hypothetical protein